MRGSRTFDLAVIALAMANEECAHIDSSTTTSSPHGLFVTANRYSQSEISKCSQCDSKKKKNNARWKKQRPTT